jgi:adenosylmethionine-8-amino-7-oxononanoate aminotransferase
MPSKTSPIWHPFTQHALQPDMVKIARGEGAYLFAADGRRIIDAISSWWVVTHGHCHPHNSTRSFSPAIPMSPPNRSPPQC